MNPPELLTDYKEVLNQINQIDPVKYTETRNLLNGQTTNLSPFITHGIISTKTVADLVLANHSVSDSQKLLAELGCREFFHRVWQSKGEEIFNDLRFDQEKVYSQEIPLSLITAQTGIKALDEDIKCLKETGYMHNQARMWTASITGNLAQTGWYQPARWLYYHLLDGDLASNTLSWQWVVGSFSHKKHFVNQEDLNKYSDQKESHTWLDVPYKSLETMEIPDPLTERTELKLENKFPDSTAAPIGQTDKTVLLYSIWNLDSTWKQGEDVERVLWIKPSMHEEMALSPKRWAFVVHWANKVEGLKIFVGTKAELFPDGTGQIKIITREYPETADWPGSRDEREWLYPQTTGYFKNFFSFWKEAQKEIEGLKSLHEPRKN